MNCAGRHGTPERETSSSQGRDALFSGVAVGEAGRLEYSGGRFAWHQHLALDAGHKTFLRQPNTTPFSCGRTGAARSAVEGRAVCCKGRL